ncbi:L,D-transpeptidase family protein [Sphingomonas cavernae]|uniref:Murein L,D-transpeptidase n=1 Tax=Sphingomonas cavernae TaxID=2320861 RepID=A0A418WQ51_9SPHN|nr:L,D-transpeptidase family protein [Sphingomonas cavernae]RJF93370.1 murein L,D-transpeptidase [Sphingomonas cavernae]
MSRLSLSNSLKLPIVMALALAGPALGQTSTSVTPPPALPPTVVPATPPSTIPFIVPPAPRPLPTLSAAQSAFLVAWLRGGEDHGLSAGPESALPPQGEALVKAVLDRAHALHGGRVPTTDFLSIWALRPAEYDPLPGFTEAVETDRLPQWVAGLTPPYAGYDGLRKGLSAYEAIRDAGGWPTLTAKSDVTAIRSRLAIEDKAVTPDEKIVDALQRAQRRYGLNPTGLLDARTLAALNVPVADRIASISANMERWRWLPRELPVNRVQVNIAAAVLTMFEGDQPVASMRAVTGRPGNETPMLASSIHSIVVNPQWNVPNSIATKELFPKGRAALLREGYKIIGTPKTGQRIVQPSGPGNALGRLKFDFDNPFAVYLHDTPARAKFSSYDRLASHGCVRLEKPLPLAEMMLKNDPIFAGQVQTVIDAGKTQRVKLPQEVAVYLLYWTAFASGNGTMNFRADPYGWDKLLASKIDASNRRAANVATASKE